MSRPQPGDRISNYLLDELIGTGSFGEVWRARHHIFPEIVAVKIPTDPQYVRHLQREGLAIHGLRNENIVRALDMDPYADPPYLVMEYVDGRSLRQLLEAHPQGLPLAGVLAVLQGVLLALKVAHEAGLVHRDIKPENILIEGRESPDTLEAGRVKVTDFGLGHVGQPGAGSVLQSGSLDAQAGRRMAGTLAYMSPEQRDGRPVDARSDLYSVGILLHEMLTGSLPQGYDLPGSLRPKLPQWIDRVFEKCYTRQDRRFASAADMCEEVERHWEPAAAFALRRAGRELRIRRHGDGWQCAGCMGTVRPDDQFCMYCGRQLADVIPRCPSCHAFVGRHDNFCILCGSGLSGEAGSER
jgi:serine/threonine-protein kinase